MKYYPMGSLSRYILNNNRDLRAYPYTKRQVIALISGCAEAYSALHAAGISHNDVKPDNVLLEYDASRRLLMPVVTDFGIARLLSDVELHVKAFQTGNLRGMSVNFAAPEVFDRVLRNILDT